LPKFETLAKFNSNGFVFFYKSGISIA